MLGRSRTRILHGLLIVAAAGVPGIARAQAASPAPADAEVLAIYRVVIDSLYVQDRHREVIIRDSTGARPPASMDLIDRLARRVAPDLPPEALAELRRLSATPHAYPAELAASVPIRRLTRAEMAAALPGENPHLQWTHFFQKYPGSPGIIRLSPVGFDSTRRYAVLLAGQGCGALCGSASLVILRRPDNGKWRIAMVETYVVS